MERRKALAVAASLAFVVVTAGAAMAANVSLLKSAGTDGPVGQLDVRNVAQLTRTKPTASTPGESTSTSDPGSVETPLPAGSDGGPTGEPRTEPSQTPEPSAAPDSSRSPEDPSGPSTTPGATLDVNKLFPNTTPAPKAEPETPESQPAPTTTVPTTATTVPQPTTTRAPRDGGLDD